MEGKIEDSVQWDDFIENNHENKNNYYKVTAFSEKNLNNNNAKNASMQVFPLANGKFDGNDVTFVKIKGHSGNVGNELVDKLAVAAKNRNTFDNEEIK